MLNNNNQLAILFRLSQLVLSELDDMLEGGISLKLGMTPKWPK
jgi:hypothetical protein